MFLSPVQSQQFSGVNFHFFLFETVHPPKHTGFIVLSDGYNKTIV